MSDDPKTITITHPDAGSAIVNEDDWNASDGRDWSAKVAGDRGWKRPGKKSETPPPPKE